MSKPKQQQVVGCRHCLDCIALRFNGRHPENITWPSGLQCPTVYFMLRERQLKFAIQCASADSAVWLNESVAGNRPAALLERRGQAALSIRLLAAPCSGIKRGETATYVGTTQPPRARRTPSQAADVAAGPGARTRRTGTSSQPAQQPTKRSRCARPASAAHLGWARQRSASAPKLAAAPVPRVDPGAVIPMPPATGPSSIIALRNDAVPQRPSSPLVAWLRRLKGLMSPARQQAIVLAIC